MHTIDRIKPMEGKNQTKGKNMKISEMSREDLRKKIDEINQMLAPFLDEIARRNWSEIEAKSRENTYKANCSRCGKERRFDRRTVHLSGEICAICLCK